MPWVMPIHSMSSTEERSQPEIETIVKWIIDYLINSFKLHVYCRRQYYIYIFVVVFYAAGVEYVYPCEIVNWLWHANYL